jgi:hypothetical protein
MAQWNKNQQAYRAQDTTNFEVFMCADRYGNIDNCGGTASGSGAFGEQIVSQIYPLFQLDAIYGLNSDRFELFTNGTGITTSSTLMQVESGTGAYGYGVIRSKRALRYRPGQGALGRFTAQFSGSVQGYTQRAGFFSQEQALQVGYSTEGKFGFLRANGGKAHIHRFHITTPASGTENITVTLAGTATTVSIGAGTSTQNATGIGTHTYNGWIVDRQNGYIDFLSTSVGPLSGTFSIVSDGDLVAAGSTSQVGINQTNEWIYQEDWNHDNLTGVGGTANPSNMTLDPTKLNVYQINYRWLGVGEIRLAVENQETGDIMPVHHIHYTNQNNTVHLDNPSLKIGYVAANLDGNTGAGVTVSGASMMGAIEGLVNTTTNPIAAFRSKNSGMNTTNVKYHLLSLKSSLIDNQKINQRELLIKKVSALTTAASTAPCFLYLYLDAPTDNPLDYEPLGNASSYSRTDAQIIGGEPIAVFCVTNGAPETIDLESLRIVLPPQRTLTMAISSDSVLQKAECAITFVED